MKIRTIHTICIICSTLLVPGLVFAKDLEALKEIFEGVKTVGSIGSYRFESTVTRSYSDQLDYYEKRGFVPVEAILKVSVSSEGFKYKASRMVYNKDGKLLRGWKSSFNGNIIAILTKAGKGDVISIYKYPLTFPEELLRHMNAFYEPFRFLPRASERGAGLPVRGIGDFTRNGLANSFVLTAKTLGEEDGKCVVMFGPDSNDLVEDNVYKVTFDVERGYYPVSFEISLGQEGKSFMQYRIEEFGELASGVAGDESIIRYPKRAVSTNPHFTDVLEIEKLEVGVEFEKEDFELDISNAWILRNTIRGVTTFPKREKANSH